MIYRPDIASKFPVVSEQIGNLATIVIDHLVIGNVCDTVRIRFVYFQLRKSVQPAICLTIPDLECGIGRCGAFRVWILRRGYDLNLLLSHFGEHPVEL